MQRILKWKKGLYLALVVGITALAVYGIGNTFQSVQDVAQAHAADTLSTGSSDANNGLIPGGTLCSYYSCTGCGGCINQQVQQSAAGIQTNTTTY